jgi:RHS repeat-associated protein
MSFVASFRSRNFARRGSDSARNTTANLAVKVTSGAFDLAYNAYGELTAKTNRGTSATQTYSYSTLGALKSVTTPGGAEISYKYDAQGNRVETRAGGEATQRLIYAPGLLGPITELATADREETRFVYASRIIVPDYMVRGGQTFRLVTDQLGSLRFVVDSSTGEIAQEITYDPFGEVISDSAPGFQPFGFAGGLYSSETGLTHFGAREYDAGLGRWTSSDPISFGGGDANLYGYVMQDPVNLVDPSGLSGLNWDYPFRAETERVGDAARSAPLYGSNAAAGALNSLTGGLANRAWGVNGSCAGSGYGLGSAAGTAVGFLTGFGGTVKAYRGAQLSVRAVKSLWSPHRVREMQIEGMKRVGKQAGKDTAKSGAKTAAESGFSDAITSSGCGC